MPSQHSSLLLRLYRAPAPARDAVLALFLASTDMYLFYWENVGAGQLSPRRDLGGIALTVFNIGLLSLRRRRPVAVFIVLWLQTVGLNFLLIHTGFRYSSYCAMLAALYTVAANRPIRTATAALAGQLLFTSQSVHFLLDSPVDNRAWQAVQYSLIVLEVWSVGRWVGFSHQAAARGRRRLAEARASAVAERTRTARELHDVVANAVTVMVLQSAGARRINEAGSEEVNACLERIEGLGKTAISELRHMLLVLRAGAAPPEGDSQSFGVADLGPLLAAVRHAGLHTELTVSGVPAHLDEDVDLTAYRLVQEALTNSVKHAGPGTRAAVRLAWSERLHIEVSDDGGGTPVAPGSALSTGHGLLGMCERVTLNGGSFTAGPAPGGGFAVAATLPVALPRPREEDDGILSDTSNMPSSPALPAPPDRPDTPHAPRRPEQGDADSQGMCRP
ncbi:sensor histidine kinase [Streptomyces sp. NPDC048111]|uniref:sensor histidine kinase n=1 Tax=Streptomyces sp. NPDC048111 TaxID=3365500 RepID=UPI00371B08C2